MRGWTQSDIDAHPGRLQPGIISPPSGARPNGITWNAGRGNKADVKLEKELETVVENYLRQNEIEFLHLSPRSREKAGWPDITCAVNGVPLAIELKSATGVLSADQIRVLAKMRDNGWWTVVATTFEEVHRVIQKARKTGKAESASE